MKKQSRQQLREYFRANAKPTESQFAELIESNVNFIDDLDERGKIELLPENIPASRITGLSSLENNGESVSFYASPSVVRNDPLKPPRPVNLHWNLPYGTEASLEYFDGGVSVEKRIDSATHTTVIDDIKSTTIFVLNYYENGHHKSMQCVVPVQTKTLPIPIIFRTSMNLLSEYFGALNHSGLVPLFLSEFEHNDVNVGAFIGERFAPELGQIQKRIFFFMDLNHRENGIEYIHQITDEYFHFLIQWQENFLKHGDHENSFDGNWVLPFMSKFLGINSNQVWEYSEYFQTWIEFCAEHSRKRFPGDISVFESLFDLNQMLTRCGHEVLEAYFHNNKSDRQQIENMMDVMASQFVS